MKAKIALFYTSWTEGVADIVSASRQRGVTLDAWHYQQLTWRWRRNQWQVTTPKGSLAKYQLFYFRTVGDQNESLPLLLEYSQRHQIKIVDEYLRRLGGAMRKRKSSEAAVLLSAGINYPRTVFSPDWQQLGRLLAKWPKPVVLKKTGGRHGSGTFLIRNHQDFERALLGRRRANFLLQEYIPNDGDYRLFLIGYQVVAGFKRQPKENKLVLNRSQGSSQPLTTIPAAIRQLAETAARTLAVEISGIDLVVNQKTGQPVIIEVNQAPEFRIMKRRSQQDIGGLIVDYLLAKALQRSETAIPAKNG